MTRTKIFKRSLPVLIVIMMLLSTSIVAFAAYHSQTVSMLQNGGPYTTLGMTFEGTQVSLLSDAKAVGVLPSETHYQVRLEKQQWWGWSEYQTVNLPNNTQSSITWTNTGSGTFRFVFSRPRYDIGSVTIKMQAMN